MVTNAAITLLVVAGLVIPLLLVLRSVSYQRAGDDASLEARSIAAVLLSDPGTPVAASVVAQANQRGPWKVEVILPDGQKLGSVLPDGPDVAQARSGSNVVVHRSGAVLVDQPVALAQGTDVLRVWLPASAAEGSLVRAAAILILLGVVLVLLAVLVGDRLARTVTGPVRELEQLAGDLSDGQLDARAAIGGPKEIRSVGVAVNALGARIKDLVRAERESVADISHRLRTPLTALRLHAEAVADERSREILLADAASLEAAADAVIHRVRRGPSGERSCDLAAVVEARMQFWRLLAESQARPVTVNIEGAPIPVGLGSSDVEAVLDALVGNVFAHTEEPTGFSVSAIRRAPGGLLVVEDDGPGFDPRLLDRGQSGRGGTGLGLDIARGVAEGSGGTFDAVSHPGGGATVSVGIGSRSIPARATDP
jgi:signal transduction histidine kinase